MAKTYDPRVFELAELFLKDTKIDTHKNRVDLALHLQSELESWITFEEEEQESDRIRREKANRQGNARK